MYNIFMVQKTKQSIRLIIFFICIIALAIVLISCGESKEEQNDDFEFSLSTLEQTYMLTKYKGDSDKVVIPEYFNGLRVTSIQKRAFENKSLSSIVIPESIEIIGDEAFKNCKNIISIEFPNSLKEVGKGMLSGCNKIKSIKIPFSGKLASIQKANTRTLFGYIFGTEKYDDSYLCEQFFIEGEVTAFYIPNSLEEITITGSESILEGSFSNIKTLKKISLSSQINAIKSFAFINCYNLEKVLIDNSQITQIDSKAFYNDEKLTNFPELNNLTKIGEYSFFNTGIESFSVTKKLKQIDSYAFANCSKLKNINGENEQATFKDGIFLNCVNLENIFIPSLITAIPKSTFSGCEKIKTIDLSNTYIMTINIEAFSNCTNLEEIRMPSSLISIRKNAFSGCEKLTKASFSTMTTQFVVSLESQEYLVTTSNEESNAKNLTINYVEYNWQTT